jgi:hypothetical protein
MQTKRIPLVILAALELGGTACTKASDVQPCLKIEVAPREGPSDDPPLGPCLMVSPEFDVAPAPRLDVPNATDPSVQPCLDVPPCLSPIPPEEIERTRDVTVGPCLKVSPPREPQRPGAEPRRPEPPVHPCLRVQPPDVDLGPCLEVAADPPPETPPAQGTAAAGMAHADLLESFAETLPADVLARLRRFDS